MTKRARTEAHDRADANYRNKHKRKLITFHAENDAELWEWLMSQVNEESELPKRIKELLYQTKNQ